MLPERYGIMGMSGAQAARWLDIGQPAVQRTIVRGGKFRAS